jgi:hypothetical protein
MRVEAAEAAERSLEQQVLRLVAAHGVVREALLVVEPLEGSLLRFAGLVATALVDAAEVRKICQDQESIPIANILCNSGLVQFMTSPDILRHGTFHVASPSDEWTQDLSLNRIPIRIKNGFGRKNA